MRVKRGTAGRKKHKRLLKLAEGYRGQISGDLDELLCLFMLNHHELSSDTDLTVAQ